MTNLCKECGDYFTARRSNETVCGSVCKKAHANKLYKAKYTKGGYKKVSPVTRVCTICETSFETRNKMQKCCSYECSDVNRRVSARKLHDSGRYNKPTKEKLPIKAIDPSLLVRGRKHYEGIGAL